ncbi:MAG: hypothetical protein AMXMBFR57_06930 [Acidimicrobiia bacterium]
MPPILEQVIWIFVLALPAATIAWTVTHEEIFREFHEYCVRRSKQRRRLVERKFFYALTCEYCFSHYVVAGLVALTGFRLLLDDWRGYLLSIFAVVAVTNVYLSLYARVRVDIKSERLDIAVKEETVKHP